jgi:hypothetical protein
MRRILGVDDDPHMRGFEAIRVFHDRAPRVPLIAIYGYAFSSPEAAGPDFLQLAMRLGATRCLREPAAFSHDDQVPCTGRLQGNLALIVEKAFLQLRRIFAIALPQN